ncbi:hypothetical protein IT570_02860 [Candidatus Sumerlaeota bacterium]|nr:hypothetical protein [Candidatus Sumerlaeota bacterium]
MPWNRYVVAYHGCGKHLAQQVVTGKKKLLASKNEYDWLGHDLYFWEHSAERASHCAKYETRSQTQNPAVIGAVIDLGNCLNLMEANALSPVEENSRKDITPCERLHQPVAKNSGKDFKARHLDCAVFETCIPFGNLKDSRHSTPFAPFSSKAGPSTKMQAFVPSTTFKSACGIRG